MNDNVSAIYQIDPLTWDYGGRKGVLKQKFDSTREKAEFNDNSSNKNAWLTALPFSNHLIVIMMN